MKFDEIKNRITGISCPVFGISWAPPVAETTVARRVVTFLEDRRVLYAPGEAEVPEHCVESVLNIRRHLTDELQQLQGADDLAGGLRAMRAACRKFLDSTGEFSRSGRLLRGFEGWAFNQTLGELRGVFGIQVARLAASYGLDVEGDLARIIPAVDSDAEDDRPHR
jgi:hypothetical protein